MPQADLHYTADQSLNAPALLAEIERIIHANDDTSGYCKGRGHRIEAFHHSHLLLRLSMLPKPHRDADYARDLGAKLATALQTQATAPCAVNVQIRFDLEHYTAAPLGKPDL